MLGGRTRRKKMRDQNRGGAERRRTAGFSDDAAAPAPNAGGGKWTRRTVSFNDDKDKGDGGGGGGGGKRTNPKSAPLRRSSHLADTSAKEQCLENDAALKNELSRIERESSEWSHPMGFNLLSALRVFNAPMDPILNNTGYWIQPEELDDIPEMFNSYLNVNCLYYSLVGVLAVETSLWLPIPPPGAPSYAHWLIAVSRFCWAANGVWSLAAVVASFHILWGVYATPTWARRRFVFDNSRTISVVYALGAPNFAFMLIGAITGTMGNIVSQEGFTRMDWVPAAIGLSVGAIVTIIFVLCSGSIIAKVVRPWKVADDNLVAQKRRWSEHTGRSVRGFLESYEANGGFDSKEDPDGDLDLFDANDYAGFADLGMPDAMLKLSGAGLTLDMLKRVNNDVLLDHLLQGAGLDKAGDRLRVIFFIRDAPPAVVEDAPPGGDVLPRGDASVESTPTDEFRDFERVLSASKYASYAPGDAKVETTPIAPDNLSSDDEFRENGS